MQGLRQKGRVSNHNISTSFGIVPKSMSPLTAINTIANSSISSTTGTVLCNNNNNSATINEEQQKHLYANSNLNIVVNNNSNGKYLAPLVAEVHPEQSNTLANAAVTYKSPSALSSSASLPTSVSTPFCPSQSSSSTVVATVTNVAYIPAGMINSTISPAYLQTVHNNTFVAGVGHGNGITPTTGSAIAALPPLRSNPGDWSIEEVIQFIECNDSTLAVHGDLFRRHVRIAF